MEELGVARIAEPNFSFLTLHLKNQRPPSDLTEASDFFIGQRLFARCRPAICGVVPDSGCRCRYRGKANGARRLSLQHDTTARCSVAWR